MILNFTNLTKIKDSQLTKILLAIGLVGFVKNFLIFTFYGFFITLYIDIFHGLKKELPESLEGALSGPISIYTFITTLVFSIIALLICSKVGKIECDFNNKRPKRIFYFSIPLCEASISVGVVICAALLGIAIALHLASLWDEQAKGLYASLYACSLFIALFIYPVILVIVSILDQKNKAIKQSLTFSVLYIAIIFLYAYYNMPLHNMVISAAGIFLLVIGLIAFRFLQKKYNK
jgi:hypothetical protein